MPQTKCSHWLFRDCLYRWICKWKLATTALQMRRTIERNPLRSIFSSHCETQWCVVNGHPILSRFLAFILECLRRTYFAWTQGLVKCITRSKYDGTAKDSGHKLTSLFRTTGIDIFELHMKVMSNWVSSSVVFFSSILV